MNTFLHKSLTCLLTLSLAFGAPARVFAAAVSDEMTVSLSDGSKAYLFKVSGYSDAKDGDLFVVVTEGNSRTVYRPVADPLSDPDFAAYRGVVLPSGSKATRFQVVGLKAVGASLDILTGKWRLIDLDLDFGSVDLDAEGSPEKGYTLTGKVTFNDVGTFNVDGSWSAADASAPVTLKVDNAAKGLFEASLGKALPKGWLKLGDKITATLSLDQAWVEDLKRGKKADGKTTEPKKVDIKVSMPLTLKMDPTKDAFKLTAMVDPGAKTTTLALDPGQSWKDPFGYLPVTFSKLDVKSDLAFETFTVGAAGDMTFFKAVGLTLDATIKAGKVTAFKLKAAPPADFLSASLRAMKVPSGIGLPLDEVKRALEELLKYVKMGSLDISAPDFDAKLADLGLKFSVDMPTWKHDFDLKLPGVNLTAVDNIAVDLGSLVFPILVLNIDKITAGLVFAGLSGRWNLGTLDLGLASADLWAEGDAAKGYTLTGKVTVKGAGDFTVNGFWGPSAPLDPIVFQADNILKPALEKSLSQMISKDALAVGDKVTVTVGLPPSWVERMKRGGRAAPKGAAAAKEQFTLEASMPFTAKIDPKKPPFKFTAKTRPIEKTLSVAFDDGQSWDKPLDALPVKFDKLTVTTDTGLTALSITAAGKLDFLVPCDVEFAAAAKNGASASYTAVLKPAAGTNIVKAILDGRVPAVSKTLVDALLPNAVVSELAVAVDAKKSKPDVRLKFTMSKGTFSQKFDILVKDADMANPSDYAGKAAPQIVEQLAGKATGDVLAALGIRFDWTLVDLNLKAIAMRIDASGDPKDKYSLAGKFKLPLAGKFEMKGAWYPAKPVDPIVFEADNIFKPIVEEMLGGSIPKDKFELKETMSVTLTLSGEAVAALQSGGGGGGTSSGGKSGGAPFKVDIGFPMKLQIDPTKKAFDMTGRVYPFEQTATLELDPGVTWEKPFGIFPMTFSSLVAGTDPSFTTLTINASGRGNFLGDMDFVIDALLRKGQKPTLTIEAQPSGDMVAAILKQARVPSNFLMPEIRLEKFNVKADLAQLMAGKLPSAQLKFSFKSVATKAIQMRAVSVDIDVPSLNFNEPDKFARFVGEELVKVARSLVVDVTAAALDGAKKTVTEAATDPVGTGKKAAEGGKDAAVELGKAAYEFGKDPTKGAEDLAKGAADLAATIGKGGYDAVSGEVNKWASDPLGTAEAKAKAAWEKAEAALDAVSGFLSDIGGAIAGVFSNESAKEKRGKREVQKLKDLGERAKAAKTAADLRGIMSATDSDEDLCWTKDGGRVCGHRTVEFRKILRELTDGFNAAGLAGLRDRAGRAASRDEFQKILDEMAADPALCSGSGDTLTCTADSVKLWKEILVMRDQVGGTELDKLRVVAERARSKDDVDKIFALIKNNKALCSGKPVTCVPEALDFWNEVVSMKDLVALKMKVSKAANAAALDKLETELKATYSATNAWPTFTGHIESASKLIEVQRGLIKEHARKAVSDFILTATDGDINTLEDWLEGKSKSLYNPKNGMHWASPAESVHLPAELADLKKELDARRKDLDAQRTVAWFKKIDGRLADTWDEGELNKLKEHFGGKSVATWPDISSISADEKRSVIARCDDQLSKLPAKRGEILKSLRVKITARESEGDLMEMKMILTADLDGSRYRSKISFGLWPLTRAQKEGLLKEVEERLKEVQEAQMKAFRDSVAATKRRTDLTTFESYLGGTNFEDMPRIDALTTEQVEALQKEVQKRDDELKEDSPKEQEAAVKAFYPKASIERLRELVNVLDSIARKGYADQVFEELPDMDELSKDQARALLKYVEPAYVHKVRTAVENYIALQKDTENLGTLGLYVQTLASRETVGKQLQDVAEKLAFSDLAHLGGLEERDLLAVKSQIGNRVAALKKAPASGGTLAKEIPKKAGNPRSPGATSGGAPPGTAKTFEKLAMESEKPQYLAALRTHIQSRGKVKIPGTAFPPTTGLSPKVVQALLRKIDERLAALKKAPASGGTLAKKVLKKAGNPRSPGATSGGAQAGTAQMFERLAAESKAPQYLAALRTHIQSGGRVKTPGAAFPPTTGLSQRDVAALMRKIDERVAALKRASASGGPSSGPASDPATKAISNLFQTILGRNPDEGGLNRYRSQYGSLGPPGIAREMMMSGEFKAKPRRFQVGVLFKLILGRAAYARELEWFANSSKPISAIAYEMMNGSEFRNRNPMDQDFARRIGLR